MSRFFSHDQKSSSAVKFYALRKSQTGFSTWTHKKLFLHFIMSKINPFRLSIQLFLCRTSISRIKGVSSIYESDNAETAYAKKGFRNNNDGCCSKKNTENGNSSVR